MNNINPTHQIGRQIDEILAQIPNSFHDADFTSPQVRSLARLLERNSRYFLSRQRIDKLLDHILTKASLTIEWAPAAATLAFSLYQALHGTHVHLDCECKKPNLMHAHRKPGQEYLNMVFVEKCLARLAADEDGRALVREWNHGILNVLSCLYASHPELVPLSLLSLALSAKVNSRGLFHFPLRESQPAEPLYNWSTMMASSSVLAP